VKKQGLFIFLILLSCFVYSTSVIGETVVETDDFIFERPITGVTGTGTNHYPILEQVNRSNEFVLAQAQNAQNHTNNWWTTPYIIPNTNISYAPILANGPVQYWKLTNASPAATLTLPARNTNRTEWLRLETWAGTNSFTFTTNAVIIGMATNNGINLCDGPFNTNTWKVMSF